MYTTVIIIKIIIITLVSILGLLFLISITIPLKYSIYLEWGIKIELQIEVFLLFKLLKIKFFIQNKHLSIKFCSLNNSIFTKQISKIKNLKNKNNNKKFYFNIRKYFNKKLFIYSFSYINEVLRLLKPSYIEIEGIYGFTDPSTTGLLCGLLPLTKEMIPSINLNLHPNFNDEIMELCVKISVQIFLSLIILKTLNFIFKMKVKKQHCKFCRNSS